MLLMCWFADAVDGLKLLILLMCWCTDAADVLMLLMHRCCWCAGAAHAADPTDVLMLLIGWCCWCADSVLCSPSPMHCNPTEWQQSVKNLHWRSVVKYQCITQLLRATHRGRLDDASKVQIYDQERRWTTWMCSLEDGSGVILSYSDMMKVNTVPWRRSWDYHLTRWWEWMSRRRIFISADYESGSILELHGGGEEVGSNQTMNPPGAAGSQHCWRQHSGDPSSSTLEQLYTL